MTFALLRIHTAVVLFALPAARRMAEEQGAAGEVVPLGGEDALTLHIQIMAGEQLATVSACMDWTVSQVARAVDRQLAHAGKQVILFRGGEILDGGHSAMSLGLKDGDTLCAIIQAQPVVFDPAGELRTASSQYGTGVEAEWYWAKTSCLSSPDDIGWYPDWSPDGGPEENAYLQMDLDSACYVAGIVTKGSWYFPVPDYSVMVSMDSDNWDSVDEGARFPGHSGSGEAVERNFAQAVPACFVRLLPKTTEAFMMRAGVLILPT